MKLKEIHSPNDIKKLTVDQLPALAELSLTPPTLADCIASTL